MGVKLLGSGLTMRVGCCYCFLCILYVYFHSFIVMVSLIFGIKIWARFDMSDDWLLVCGKGDLLI